MRAGRWITACQRQSIASRPGGVGTSPGFRSTCSRTYFADAESRKQPPSESGAYRFAKDRNSQGGARRAPSAKGRRRPKPSGVAPIVPRQVLDCVQRTLGDIDICIGEAPITCARRVSASTVKLRDVHGTVFVAECLEPEAWLAQFAKLHSAAKVSEVLVVLPGSVWEPWFRGAVASGARWEWCILTGSEAQFVVAHLGRHPQAFRVMFRELGAVVASAHPAS